MMIKKGKEMKKALCIILSVGIAMSFAACTQTNEQTTSTTSQSVEQTEVKQTESEQTSEAKEDITEITISLSNLMKEADDITVTDDEKEMGIISAEVNSDDTVTYKIKNYDKFKKKYKKDLKQRIDDLKKDLPCIKSIKYDDDFTKVTVKVDKEEYDNTDGAAWIDLSIGYVCELYQIFMGVDEEKVDISVDVIDEHGNKLNNYD